MTETLVLQVLIPSDIIDATAVVVLTLKNRKLGIYYAQEHAGFKVKGTTLQFYDEMRSTQKTVRKPKRSTTQIGRK